MAQREPTPEELDKEWRRIAETGKNDSITSMEARYQRLVREAEDALMELRDAARLSIYETHVSGRD